MSAISIKMSGSVLEALETSRVEPGSRTYSDVFCSPAPLPEAPVAEELLKAIRGKEKTEKMTEIIDSLSSVNPELRDQNSKIASADIACLCWIGILYLQSSCRQRCRC